MPDIDLSKQHRSAAIASLQRYCEENFSEPLSELRAGLLLNYILEEIGPAIYNRGVTRNGAVDSPHHRRHPSAHRFPVN